MSSDDSEGQTSRASGLCVEIEEVVKAWRFRQRHGREGFELLVV